ncbi:Trans-aconitate 2-methyltransferase [uncultured archaeon]|nr:Trans-aconitate 2-methyltransferase [uncultured archaeon]
MINTNDLTSDYIRDLNPKEVLDLGCGKGRISLMFLKKGSNVVGVDKKTNEICQKNFKFINSDILDFKIDKKYDLIIASLVLHFLEKSDAIRIIRDIKENTSENGYNLLLCLSKKDDFYKKGNFYPDLDEVKKIYSDWKIVKSTQDFTPIEEHGGLKPHRHNIVFVLAKK